MAGHTITPYELTAHRKNPKKDEDKDQRLLLATELVRTGSLDLLDALTDNITDIDPISFSDHTRLVSCVLASRNGDYVDLVFACDVSGEQEPVRDADADDIVFVKGPEHRARYHSACRVWRPPSGDTGLMLLHSPWGRGGSKSQVLRVMQNAINAEDESRAKLEAQPKISHALLEQWLRDLEATRITYVKESRIRSNFAEVSGQSTARADLSVTVKGTDTKEYRDAMQYAYNASQNRERLYTVQMPGPDGDFVEETFDDVEISMANGGRTTTYSVRNDTVPTMARDCTAELRAVYRQFPIDSDDTWPELLLDGCLPLFHGLLEHAQRAL